MFGDFEKSIGETIDAIISNPFVQLALQAIAFYIVLVWLLTAFWAFRDMQHRTTNPVAPYLAAGIIIAFTPFLFLFAVVLYRIVRPRETIAEANERALAEEAILAEIEARPHCANCSRAVEGGVDHLPHLPQPAAARLPQRSPPRGARLDAVRVVRQGLRATEVVAPVYMPGPRAQLEGQPVPMQVDGPRQPILAPGMLGPEMTPARER